MSLPAATVHDDPTDRFRVLGSTFKGLINPLPGTLYRATYISIFVLNAHAPFRGTTMNENYNLY
jgi:hypothetical protein